MYVKHGIHAFETEYLTTAASVELGEPRAGASPSDPWQRRAPAAPPTPSPKRTSALGRWWRG